MKWIVTNALPPAAMSQVLEQALLSRSSSMRAKLAQLFDPMQAQSLASAVSIFGCTPTERVTLQTLGCPLALSDHPSASETVETLNTLPVGSAVAAWQCGITQSDEPVWIAQACATLLSAERATLLSLTDIQASEADLSELHSAIVPLLGDSDDPIWLEPLSAGHWRVRGELPAHTWLATPGAVRGQDLGDWWPTDQAWRPWRRIVNEIQMCWHDHPVNERREQQGLPAINGVWLHGGAPGWTPQPDPDVCWITDLTAPADQSDWSAWLAQYENVVTRLIDETSKFKAQKQPSDADFELILTGEDRVVFLRPSHGSRRTAKRREGGLLRALSGSFSKTWSRLRMVKPARGITGHPSSSMGGSQPSQPTQAWSHWWNNV